jgi:cell pole-organizing protein PopZ
MSRPMATSEPSMEDILASIRKIIAEEPAGSRANSGLAQNGVAAAPKMDRSLFVKPSDVAHETVATSSAPQREPYLRSPTQPSGPPSRELHTLTADAFSRSSEALTSDPRLFQRDTPAQPSASQTSNGHGASKLNLMQRLPASVDEQLSDLLDDIVDDADDDANVAPAINGSAHAVDAVGADHASIDVAGPDADALTPGDGIANDAVLVADTDRNETVISEIEDNEPEATTFSRPSSEQPNVSPLPHRETLFQTIASMETASSAEPTYRRRDVLQTDNNSASDSHAAKAAFAAVDAAAVAEQRSRDFYNRSAASPSVSATLPPEPATTVDAFPARNDAFSRAMNSMRDEAESAAQYIAVQVLENPVMLDAFQAPHQVHPSAAAKAEDVRTPDVPRVTPSSHALVTPTLENSLPPMSATMEDTVADLLRPMLKSWLAENMPKIVERALRREISELARGPHSSAAE